MTSTVKSKIMTQEEILRKYLETKDEFDDGINPELEVRFGTRNIGKITKNKFDNTIQYLLSKNFNFEDNSKYYLNIKADNIRVQIDNIFNIQNYCKTNQLPKEYPQVGYSFTEKSQYTLDGFPVKVNEDKFNYRISYSTEKIVNPSSEQIIELINNWDKKNLFNRLINRYSLIHDEYPLRIDFSIVREIKSNNIRESNIFNIIPKYEIEIEILNDKISNMSLDVLNQYLKVVCKYVLSGLQFTNFPVTYNEINNIESDYLKLVGIKDNEISPNNFIGPSSVTLQLNNIRENSENSTVINVRDNYTVTDKADGERKLLFINEIGKIYLITTQTSIEFTGAQTKNKDLYNSLLDGEHIKHNKYGTFINLYAAFDIYFIDKKDLRNLEFIASEKSDLPNNYRWNLLENTIKNINPVLINSDKLSPIRIDMKKFYDVTPTQSLFAACDIINKSIKDNQYEYYTDGFILTPKNYGVGLTITDKRIKNYKHTWEYSFKWKPAEYNTIDFLLTTKKDKNGNDYIGSEYTDGIDTKSADQIIQYKTAILRVGYDVKKHGFANPCQLLIDDEIPILSDFDSEDRYKPVQFVPSNPYDPDAGIANILLKLDNINVKQMFTEENEVIEDNTIIECRYDINKPKGWRWIPLRIRYDKTAEYRSGYKSYGNAYHVAQNNWYSIHNPITIEMITTGKDIPNNLEQDDIYYNQVKGEKKTKALRDFHNLVVKNKLITSVSNPGDSLIDYAVGKGGDISKWITAKLSFVFGIDYSRDNIRNPVDGVCSRYISYQQKFEEVPNALFVYGNSNKNIKDTTGIFSDVGKKITNAIFGIGDKNSLGKGVAKSYGVAIDGFNISSIQFAIHYMFESTQSLNEFLKNVSECTKVGGYFIGTCFNGKRIFNLLSNIKQNQSYTFFDRDKKQKLLEITKQYNRDEFNDDISSLGYAIDIFQVSINKTIREYLVNYDYLTSVLENYGFVPLNSEELKQYNLTSSIDSFEVLFKQMQANIKTNPKEQNNVGNAFKMTREEKDISFLNNYFIYKKVRNINTSDLKDIINPKTEEEELENIKATLQAKDAVEDASSKINTVLTEKATKKATEKATKKATEKATEKATTKE